MMEPEAFAAAWATAWNRRDLDAILAHFSPGIVFTSPKAVDTVGRPTVAGLAQLRGYWERALARIQTLEFVVVRTDWDPRHRSLAILYDRRINGSADRALELLTLDAAGTVVAAEVFYGVMPEVPAAASATDPDGSAS
jgi:limonene-1,2-epoxide hydrolase